MLVAGNWKMFKGPRGDRGVPRRASSRRTASTSSSARRSSRSPPRSGEGVPVYAQNVHWAAEGAFTGEVSAAMLVELGVEGAIVGHSERRQHFGETDETVRLRCEAALDGRARRDRLRRRDGGGARGRGDRRGAPPPGRRASRGTSALVIAYEPVWAIGTGKTATPEIAQDAHALIKSLHDTPRPLRRLGQAGERRRAAGAARRRRRARRRRLARARVVRGDLPRRRAVSRTGCRSSRS